MEKKGKNVKESKVYDGCAVCHICEGICREYHLKHGDCPAFYRYRLERLRNKKGKLSRKYSQIFVR